MQYDMKSIAGKFQIHGRLIDVGPSGSGHINDTFTAVYDRDGVSVRYIIQRINHDVFTKPAQVMENIARVTEHIRQKLSADGAEDISRQVMTLVAARDGGMYHVDADGNYWRTFIFIEKAQTYNAPKSADQAYESARMFGYFQMLLADLPEPALHETIPGFHDAPKRLIGFNETVKADSCNRAKDAKNDIDFVLKHASTFDVLPNLVERGKIPVRTTHNDTKINNIMFDDDSGKGICVIDLDTVMPGLVLFDFGDIVRTTATSADEDERDLSKVVVEMPQFEALVRGYLSSAGQFINKYERENLVLGSKMIILEQCLRFLKDHLDGDKYYKIHREGHNLDRSRTQLKLFESIIEQEDEMNSLVESV